MRVGDTEEKEVWCVRSTTDRTLQTIAKAYRQMCEGEEPWIALGNFRNAWYGHAKDRRVELVSEPLGKPAQDTEFANRWGAFLCRHCRVSV